MEYFVAIAYRNSQVIQNKSATTLDLSFTQCWAVKDWLTNRLTYVSSLTVRFVEQTEGRSWPKIVRITCLSGPWFDTWLREALASTWSLYCVQYVLR